MNTSLTRLLKGVGVATSFGVMSMLWATSPVAAQSAAPAPTPAAAPDDKDVKDAAKDTAKDAKDAAKDTSKDVKDAAKDTAKDARDTAKDTRDAARDTTKDVRDSAKDTAKDARDTAKDTRDAARDTTKNVRESARDTAKDARDTAKDTRDAARDTTKDVRDSARDTTRDARDTVRDTRTPRDSRDRDARDSRDARDTRDRDARDNRDSDARDTDRRDVRDRDTRDTRRDVDTRDTRRDVDARDTRRDVDTRDTRRDVDTRDTRRDSVDVRRDTSRQSSSVRTNVNSRTQFNVNTFRAAEMGLWFRSANNGLVINDIGTSGPITRLGFQQGDQIVSVNGQRVVRERDFIQYLYANNARNNSVNVIVLRDGRQQTVAVQPSVFIDQSNVVQHDPLDRIGLIVDDRSNDVQVLRVMPRSPAYYAGFRRGDVIVAFDDQPVERPEQFVALVDKVDTGVVPVKVDREGQTRMLDLEMDDHADVHAHDEVRVRDEAPPVDRRNDDVRTTNPPVAPAPVVVPVQPRVNVQVQPVPAPRGGILPRARGR
jgi:hypothetical protein